MKDQSLKSKQTLRKSKSQVMLSSTQHQYVLSLLPKNYSLIQKKDFLDFVNAGRKVQALTKVQGKRPRALSESNNPPLLVQNIVSPNQAATDTSSKQPPKPITTNIANQGENKETPRMENIQPTIGKQSQLPLTEILANSLSQIVEEMINHPSFQILYAARKKNPNIRKQLRDIDRNLKGKKYEIEAFKQDLNQLFITYFSLDMDNPEISSFQEVIFNKITDLQTNIAKAKSLQEAHSKPVQSITIPVHIEQVDQQQVKERIQTRWHIQGGQKSNEYEELKVPLPIKKGRNCIPERPHSTKISLKDIASLGYNMARLQSKDLQTICMALCNSQYMNSSSEVQYYNINLQKLTAHEFLQLQAFVKNALKAQKIHYQGLIDYDQDDYLPLQDN